MNAVSRRATSGFTLLELMVSLAVLAILVGIAVPSLSEATLASKLKASANDLVAGVAMGRSEAIKRNAVTSLCVSSDGASCGSGGWEQGWIVISGSTVIQKHPAAPTGFKVTSSVAKIDFQPSGVGNTQASVTVCRSAPTAGAQERVVNVSATGRAYVSKTATGSCS
ncbi:GspH/FimT family pseudopilin [Pseudomonas nicosulfuronedens]|uniref:Type II secretion system protein H n=1 Tax=Pseudomonas nicosulfuronedens TaxID=2571105 RepID=A0A5R9QW74_9PSED|nr:GspH/FimT family pseudopilin [Pseudomonas nicosulfuronedens]MDH1009944.1 GspH/FimT family pseudopilin [Pseudomonas nicosulfuronedens]MDH1978920.1 GspH/FimT family pseudopilin [Pseudomonas nicosulfuronedens]MDH2028401.1 GspH/FimT family pseudopilin [Pseudomonas nicosulfuronedens]TLX74166.1 prepilin-type N-terminal cleavage/methylation domain-containing protein [Pseudomonas nicosulfuronedens]